MGENEGYYISCWNCSASFNTDETPFCSHSNPTVLCPYCFKCSCDAPDHIREEIEKNAHSRYFVRKREAMSGTDRKLGEILLRSGKIGEKELKEVIRVHRTSNKRMGEIFIDMGIITEEELELYLLGQKSKVEIKLKDYLPDLDLVEKVGLDICLKRDVIPLEYFEIDDKRVLKIAVSSQKIFNLIKENKELGEYILIPCYSEKDEIDNVIKKIKQYSEIRELILLK